MTLCTTSHHNPGPNLSLRPLLGERAWNARIKMGPLKLLFTRNEQIRKKYKAGITWQ